MICICEHCSTPSGSKKFCSQCSTAEGRKAQDKANDELFMETFGKHYVCKYCEKKKLEREKKKLENK